MSRSELLNELRMYAPGLSFHEPYTVGGRKFEFVLKTPSERDSFRYTVEMESTVIKDVQTELQADDVFFDIGAHYGVFTCVAATVIDNGTIVAVEPVTKSRNRLSQTIAHNGLDVILVDRAFADIRGKATLKHDSSDRGDQEYTLLNVDNVDDSEQVKVTTGDHFLATRDFPQPDVLKIDAEGAESRIISGFEQVLDSESVRAVYCERHEKYQYKEANPMQLLERLGFKTRKLTSFGDVTAIKAVRE